jgi:hypothetical protein
MGIGSHDAKFLGSLADIGTERGAYEYMTAEEKAAGNFEKINQFFDKSLFKIDKAPGIIVSLPEGNQVYCTVESE